MKIGVIGAGGISANVHLPLLSCITDVRIKFIADIFDPKDLAKPGKLQALKIKSQIDPRNPKNNIKTGSR